MRIGFNILLNPFFWIGCCCLFFLPSRGEQKMNQCVDDQIRSIQLTPHGLIQGDPVIGLNKGEKLRLLFDDLGPDQRKLEYRIVHCDKNWEPTNMAPEEYMRGFLSGRFENVAHSFNTKISYRSYLLDIPNAECEPTISGNYCIEVFQAFAPEPVLFRRRFSIAESLVNPQVTLRRRGSCSSMETQQLEIKVPTSTLRMQSATTELAVRITQNGLYLPQPGTPGLSYNNPNTADFSGINQACFPGGLEYLNFDISNLRSQSVHVRKISFGREADSVVLLANEPETRYSARKDLNGAFKVDQEEYRESSRTDADYVYVSFELKCPKSPYEVFVLGDFCGWEKRGDNWMQYDESTQSYKACILMKQAYYNYQYFAFDQEGEIQWKALQLSSSDTENRYGVYVYLKRPGDRYERLIGFRNIFSDPAL